MKWIVIVLYSFGWCAAMATIDINIKERDGRTHCGWPPSIYCPGQILAAAFWPAAVTFSAVNDAYKSDRKSTAAR